MNRRALYLLLALVVLNPFCWIGFGTAYLWLRAEPATPEPVTDYVSMFGEGLSSRASVYQPRGDIVKVEVFYEDETSTVLLPGAPLATDTPSATTTPTATATSTPPIAATWTPTHTYTPPPTNTPRATATEAVVPSATATSTPFYTPTIEVNTPSPTLTPTLETFPACGGTVNNVAGLNMRSSPSIDGDLIIQLQHGGTVEVVKVIVYEQHINEWAYVISKNTGFAGYVAAWYYDGIQLLVWDETDPNCLPPDVEYEYPNAPLPGKVAKCIGGYHVLMGSSQYFLNFLEGVCWVKGLTGSEHLALQAKAIDPSIIIVDRSLLIGGHLRDGPTKSEWDDPAGYYKLVKPGWTPGFDYYEFKNEDDASDPAKETDFNIAMLELMGKDGYCGLAMSSGPGNPPLEYWYELIRLLRWIDTHPCGTWPDGSLKYHGLAWHMTGKMPLWVIRHPLSYIYNLWITERHVFINELLETTYGYSLRDDSDLEHFKGVIVITEMGWQDYVIPNTSFTCEEVRGGWQATIEAYEATQIIDGFHMWNLGGTGQWVDLSDCLPMPVVVFSMEDIRVLVY